MPVEQNRHGAGGQGTGGIAVIRVISAVKRGVGNRSSRPGDETAGGISDVDIAPPGIDEGHTICAGQDIIAIGSVAAVCGIVRDVIRRPRLTYDSILLIFA